MDEEIAGAIENFFKRLTDPTFIFRTGLVWPDAAGEELKDKDQEFQRQFWIELEKVLKEKEKSLGHIHKGGIYWSLAIILLGQGNLTQAIDYLNRSSDEDRQRGDTFSAAIGLSSILKPLVKRFKKKEWRFDEEIMLFYELLAQEDRSEFARRIGGTHDQVAGFGMTVIKDEFFHFIVNEEIRRVVHSSYIEIRDILLGRGLKTYFSCVFSAGSILEGMLGDLFSRNDQEVWRLFRANTRIDEALNLDSRLRKTDYDASLTLGEKIMVLRILSQHGGSPIPMVAILQMLRCPPIMSSTYD